MNEELGTSDLVIGILAALGVVVLLVVFVVVAKQVLFKNDSDTQ